MKTKSFLFAGLSTVVIVSMTACATTSTPGGASSRNRISGEELATSNHTTVYQALELLRPQWLFSRARSVMGGSGEGTAGVYINNNRVGDLEYLRTVYINEVAELRFWEPGQQTSRFGMGNARGVIEVILR